MFSNIKAVRVQEIIMSGSYDVIGTIKYNNLSDPKPNSTYQLPSAKPLFYNFSQYPAVNEIVIFGQKTLYSGAGVSGETSALTRVNVRRLLIKVKKFIASTSRFLVFEQNNSTTRSRFLNIVNPYLEQVQSNSGLNAFRVVMDDTNNTPDVVDRNILYGQIFLQPTRTAEFIVLDFTVQPTGATFPE